LEERRNVGENNCNYGDGTDQTAPILDVYDDGDENHFAYTLQCCIFRTSIFQTFISNKHNRPYEVKQSCQCL